VYIPTDNYSPFFICFFPFATYTLCQRSDDANGKSIPAIKNPTTVLIFAAKKFHSLGGINVPLNINIVSNTIIPSIAPYCSMSVFAIALNPPR